MRPMRDRLASLLRRNRPAFEARLIVTGDDGERVLLTVGSRSIALRWPDAGKSAQIELLLDGMFQDGHPFLATPPAEIPFAEIERWGPSSPPNVRWRHQPSAAPTVTAARIVAVVTRDLDFRFLFEDEAAAQRVDAAITSAIGAAGHAMK